MHSPAAAVRAAVVPAATRPLRRAAAVAVLFAAAGTASAAPAAYVPDGQYVDAVATRGVRLLSHRVEMISEGNDGETIHVRAVSVLVLDTESDRSLMVGYPVGVRGEDFSMVWNFRLAVDGREIAPMRSIEIDTVATRSGDRRHRTPVFLWQLDLKAGLPRRVEIDYDVVWSEDDLGLFRYGADCLVSKARLWDGPPPETSLLFRLSTPLPLPCLRARPGGFVYGADSLAWTFAPGTPIEDVEVSWSPDLFERFKGTHLEPYRHPDGADVFDCEVVTLFDADFWSYFPELSGSLDDPDVAAGIRAVRDTARDTRERILARSGRPLEDAAVAERFRAEGWYRPVADWTPERLTEIARLNADYCAAVAAAIEESGDLESLIAALVEVRQRFW